MIGISTGTKVHADIRGRLVPAVVLSHSFASGQTYDLYHLRIAEYDVIRQAWHFSDYGPVQAHRLMRRETHIPGLDEPERKARQGSVPGWVRQLQG